MNAHVVVTALAALLLLQGREADARAAAQDPAPAADLTLPQLVDRCFGSSEAGRAAFAELQQRAERDYAAVFAQWEAEPAGPRRECLDHALQLPAVRAATVIVAGAIGKLDTIQGGVVDYHRLDAWFTTPDVVRADDEARGQLHSGFFAVVSGTSSDTWLVQQLRTSLEREVARGPRVWLFERAHLQRGTGEQARHLEIAQWTSLPAAAAACIRRLP